MLVRRKKAGQNGGVPCTFSKKVDLGLKPGTNPLSKGQIICEPLLSPRVSFRVACGPADGNRRRGRFDNPKTTSDSGEKACLITFEITLPQACSFSFSILSVFVWLIKLKQDLSWSKPSSLH